MFTYDAKRRHLPPYFEKPFSALEFGKIPIDHRRKIFRRTDVQFSALFGGMDDWSFTIFSTLALTGVRPGELVHLRLVDFESRNGVLYARNRPNVRWQVKTHQDRSIPLLAHHTHFLKRLIENRVCGTLFQRMQFSVTNLPTWATSSKLMEAELNCRQRLQTSRI